MKTVFLFCWLLWNSHALSAQKGLTPLSNALYEYKGITAEKVALKVDEQTWLGGDLPSGKKLYVALEQPKGLVPDEDGLVYPNVDIVLLSLIGEAPKVIGRINGLFEKDKGYPMEKVTYLNMNFNLKEADYPLGQYAAVVTFRDQRSTHQANVTLLFKLAAATTPVPTSKEVLTLNVGRTQIGAVGVSIPMLSVFSKNKTYSTRYIREAVLPQIDGLTEAEFKAGRYEWTVYNKAYDDHNPVAVLQERDVAFEPAKEGGKPTLTCKAVFKETVDHAKHYKVQFKWTSADGAKRIDVLLP